VKGAGGWEDMTQTAELTTTDSSLYSALGVSVAISGDTVAVGASGTSNAQGAVYVFMKPSGGWVDMTQTATLTASDGVVEGGLGGFVSMTSDTIVAWGNQREYVFVKPEGGWADMTQTAELTASDGAMLGTVAIDGNTVVAGAFTLANYRGAAYVFVEPAGGWTDMNQSAKLAASDGVSKDELGRSVAISGNTIVVGSTGKNRKQGAVYLYLKPADGWKNTTESAQLTIQKEFFSSSPGAVALGNNANNVLVGTPGFIHGSGSEGGVYFFAKPPTGWVTTSNFSGRFSVKNAGAFGNPVAVSGNSFVAGAQLQVVGSQKTGAAFVFGPTQ